MQVPVTKPPTQPTTTETPISPISVPSGWDIINPGYKFTRIESDHKGVIWAVGADDKGIYLMFSKFITFQKKVLDKRRNTNL